MKVSELVDDDGLQVHRVGIRAAELAGVPTVLQGTMNRDFIREAMAERLAAAEEAVANEQLDGTAAPALPEAPEDETFGKPAAEITHAIDVGAHVELKRRAMQAHASQIAEDSWFLRLGPDEFALAFGTEWFIEWGRPRSEGEPFRSQVWS